MEEAKNRSDGGPEVRPPERVVFLWWKRAISELKLLGWKVKTRKRDEAIYTTMQGRTGTLALKEYASGIWRLSVDFLSLFDGRRMVDPSRPGEYWQGEFTCTAAEVKQVCERLPTWLWMYENGLHPSLSNGTPPWDCYLWTDAAEAAYARQRSPDALAEAVARCDADFMGVVSARVVAAMIGADPRDTAARVAEVVAGQPGEWEQVKPHLWRRVYSNAWVLRILREIGPDGMCDTPGILVRTWHGYDRKEHEKLEAFMQGMKARGLVTIKQNLWWRAA